MKDVLIQYGVEIIAAIVIALIGVISAWLARVLAKKMELSNIAAAQKEVTTAAQETVLELKQTVVDDLKAAAKDNKLTKEEVADLSAKLLMMTLNKLSASTLKLLASASIYIPALIKSAGEAFIAKKYKDGE